jgi:hypothetical protein
MIARKVVENVTAYTFEGTSDGDDVVAALNAHKPSGDFSLIAESGSSLTVEGAFGGGGTEQLTIDDGGAYVYRGEDWIGERTAAQMASIYRDESAGIVAWGAAQVPAILLNGDEDVAVTLDQTMPDTSYTPSARLVGAIGSLSINTVTVTDEDTVTVNVQAGLAFAGGASVVVAARP